MLAGWAMALPWIAILTPMSGALLSALLWRTRAEKLFSIVGISSSLVSFTASCILAYIAWAISPVELKATALWAPGAPLCLLLDPLSLFTAIVVSFTAFMIMLYSAGYMRGEPGQARYWALMCAFLSSMLLLVFSGDLITMLVGWKLVGFCSYTLISHYYTDEPERWVGGPPPEPMYPPSHCGLKALLTTTVGDVMTLSAIFIIYAYSGSFVLTTLYDTAGSWLTALARVPGMLALTSILLMGGPLSKSAQFPFHEWLPEAMAGPTPVSALIHAATMVKAGVFVVARFLPIFYTGLHSLGLWEASAFFFTAAYLGAITAFLAAAQGCVASELKKALAYSTMSQLGYLMLGLGASGLSVEPASGMAATFYHLAAHAIFKSALFMMAGIAIHVAGTIYMDKMGGLKKILPTTWLLTLVLIFSLMGVPPLSGFWGKDAIISLSLHVGLIAPFVLALMTVPLTAFYTTRMLGLVFHGREEKAQREERPSYLLLTPLAVLSIGAVVLGLSAPFLMGSLTQSLQSSLLTYKAIEVLSPSASALSEAGAPWQGATNSQELIISASSLAFIAVAGWAACLIYVKRRIRPEVLLARAPLLRRLRSALRMRLGLNSAYYIMAGLILFLRRSVRAVERCLDTFLNSWIPRAVEKMASAIRKLQTGHLGYNLAYLATVISALMLLLAMGVV